MFTKRVMLVGSAVVGVSYILALAGLRPQTSSAPPLSAAEPDIAPPPTGTTQSDPNIDRELRELTTSLAQLKAELAALRDRTRSAPGDVAPPRLETESKTDEQLQAEHDEYMAGIERSFEREPRNQLWSSETAQRLRQTLEAEPLMLAALRGIECRLSSCRMELQDDGSAAFSDSFPAVLHHVGAILPEAHFDHAELAGGAQLHTLYLSKSAD